MTADHKARARSVVDEQTPALLELSHAIHSDPELAWRETRSSRRVAEALAIGGYALESGVAGMPTAFRARTGHGPLHLAILAEYDALPAIGHACGHNIIASSAVGAALANEGE